MFENPSPLDWADGQPAPERATHQGAGLHLRITGDTKRSRAREPERAVSHCITHFELRGPMSLNWWEAKPEDGPPLRKSPRRWRDKFREAIRGVKLGVRGHSSFSVHFFFAALVITAAAVLGLNWQEWCLVLLCIGGVFAAELFNSTIETLFRGLDAETKARIHGCLDIAAGSVLVASLTAAVVGTVVFTRKLLILFHSIPG